MNVSQGGESSRERARAPNFPSRIGPTGLSLISLNYSRHQSLTPHSPDSSAPDGGMRRARRAALLGLRSARAPVRRTAPRGDARCHAVPLPRDRVRRYGSAADNGSLHHCSTDGHDGCLSPALAETSVLVCSETRRQPAPGLRQDPSPH